MALPGSTGRGCKISIIIPAYNVAGYIGEAIRSVLAQSLTDYEAIVINDGSTDHLEQVLEPFRDDIIYVRQENRGLSGARNTGLRLARGEYIALLDADDVLMPDYLEKMTRLMEAEPAPDIASSNAVLFGLEQWEGKLYHDIYPSSVPVTAERLLARESNIFVAVMFRRALLAEVGMFDEVIRHGAEDFDLWLRMARHGCRFAVTPEPLVKYRKRANSLSGNDERMGASVVYICEKLLASPSVTPREAELAEALRQEWQAKVNQAVARRMIVSRDFPGALKHLTLANRHLRSVKLSLVTAALHLAPELVAKVITRRYAVAHGKTQS